MKQSKHNESLVTGKFIRDHFNIRDNTGLFFIRKVWNIYDRHSKVGAPAGCLNKSTGYLEIKINGTKYKAHRLAYLYYHGHWPENDIDHINGIKTDNREENLRDVSHYENMRNQVLRKNNNSGVTGVSWHKASGKWRVYINTEYKIKHLGYYDKLEDAIKARKEAEIKYRYHENHGK